MRNALALHEPSVIKDAPIIAQPIPPDWVWIQDKVWVDRYGFQHDISLMPKEYVLNVLLFCHEHLSELRFDPYGSKLIIRLRNILLDVDTLPLDTEV